MRLPSLSSHQESQNENELSPQIQLISEPIEQKNAVSQREEGTRLEHSPQQERRKALELKQINEQ